MFDTTALLSLAGFLIFRCPPSSSTSAAVATSPVASGVLMNAKRIDFTDAADYDTITFTLQESTEGQNGYFAGVVITNAGPTIVPEPSTLLLGGLGGLLLLRRRR